MFAPKRYQKYKKCRKTRLFQNIFLRYHAIVVKKWNIQSEYKEGSVVKALLANRNISDIEEFLNPPTLNTYVKNLPSDLKKGLTAAKDLISEAVESKTPIIIYGDYDADGICATSMLYSCLKNELNHQKSYFFIPNIL